jgi:predicted ester cyclase
MRRALTLLLACLSAVASAQTVPSPAESNKALVRRAFAAFNQGDVAAINQIFDPAGPIHNTRGGVSLQGGPFTELKDACPMCAALSPRSITIDFIVADGDFVAVRSTWTGNYTGTTPHGVHIQSKPVSVVYINFYRVHNGRIVENWAQSDNLHLAEQLGFTLTPPQ